MHILATAKNNTIKLAQDDDGNLIVIIDNVSYVYAPSHIDIAIAHFNARTED